MTPDGGKGTPGSPHHWADESRIPINGSESYGGSQGSDGGFDRPDQVFDLSLDYDDDDDVLLDWEAYAQSRKRLRCCGCGVPFVVPEWWFRYSRKQRKIILGCVIGLLSAVVLLIAASVLLGVQLTILGGFHFRGTSGNDAACTWQDFRLPTHVVPTGYNLSIQASLDPPYEVAGQVDIGVDIRSAARCIVLHATHMGIVAARYGSQTGSWKQSAAQADQLILQFPSQLAVGTGTLTLQFRYNLRASLSGFYLSTATTRDGQSHAIAITDFEATSARKAFPCFDEPQLKAPFQLALMVPTGLAALSNTQEVAAEPAAGGLTRHMFAPTPPMSTYLFAMVVGNLTYVHWEVPPAVEGGERRTVRVWAAPDSTKAELDAAAGVAVTLLPFYERTFGMPYPLAKLDLVAVPDYAGGAMENWGLITFRDSYVLADPKTAGLKEQLGVASIIAHEMCHMWFGDTVTPAFWGELWLAEGPATYFENVGGEAAFQGSAFLDRFYADSVTRILDHDSASGATHPLVVSAGVDSNDLIESFFDPVVYEKGGSLLRLLRAFLNRNLTPPARLRRHLATANSSQRWAGPFIHERGPQLSVRLSSAAASLGRALRSDTGAGSSSSSSGSSDNHAGSSISSGSGDPFYAGLQRYLQQHRFSSATSSDLWDALSSASGADVVRWMDGWTHQPGFPLVVVTESQGGEAKSQDSNSTSAILQLSVKQVPFAAGDESACGMKDGLQPWWVPIAIVSSGGSGSAGATTWVELDRCHSDSLLPSVPSGEGSWIKLNAGQLTPGRVQYPAHLWARLATATADGSALQQVDVSGLIDDAWALAKAGRQDITPFLELTRALGQRGGAEYSPWAVTSRHVSAILALLGVDDKWSDCQQAWRLHVRDRVLAKALTAVTSGGGPGQGSFMVGRNDTSELRLTRPIVLRLAGDFGDTDLQQEAAVDFFKYLPPDLHAVAAQLALQSGNARAFNAALTAFKQPGTSPTDRDRARSALGAVTKPEQVQQVLQLVLSNDIRPQDVGPLLGALFSGSSGSAADAWTSFQQHLPEVYQKLGGTTRAAGAVAALVVEAAKQPACRTAAQQLAALFEEHDGILPRDPYLASATAAVTANQGWVHQHAKDLCDWLEQQ